MENKINLKHKIGEGITFTKFIESMKIREMKLSGIPNTKEQFIANYEDFLWTNIEDKELFQSLRNHSSIYCFILCTDWCPDVIWNVPVIERGMEEAGIKTEILVMEEHLETMDLFLTDGSRAQPVAVFLDSASGDVLGKWGARPAYIQTGMDTFKKLNPDKQAANYQANLDQTYREIGELHHKGREYQTVLIHELRELIENLIQVQRISYK